MRRFVVLSLALVLAAACSGEETPAPTIPSAENLASTTTSVAVVTTTTEPRLSLEQATLEFTACMRDEGIDIPDIRIDAQGRPVVGEAIEGLDTTTPEFRQALAVCSTILTRAGALDLRTDPELQAVIIDQLQAFAQCMRDEGIESFPDPVPGFSGTGSPFPLEKVPLTDPDFQTALQACQDEITFSGFGG